MPKKISPALFGIALICFLLPFVNLTCQGSKVATLTGLQLVAGGKMEVPTMGGTKQYQKFKGEPMALIAFLCGLAGVGLSFLKGKKNNGITALAGVMGVIFLFILKSRMEDEVLKNAGGMVQTDYAIGFYFVLLFYISAVAVNAYTFLSAKPESSALLETREENEYKYCPQCGTGKTQTSKFCGHCGAQFNSGDLDTRYKAAEPYKIQKNIPAAVDQPHLLQKRPEDNKAQEELAGLNATSNDKRSELPFSPQDQTQKTASLPEIMKVKGINNKGLIIAGVIGGAALIVISIFYLKQRQPSSLSQSSQASSDRISRVSETSSPRSPESINREVSNMNPQKNENIPINTPTPAVNVPETNINPFQSGRSWEGYYICGQGKTNLVLEITDVSGNNIEAIFHFNHSPSRAKGSFVLKGGYDPSNNGIAFTPHNWIERPSGYSTVGMKGNILENPKRYEGNIIHPNCGSFSLTMKE
jgi:uncharacterized Zn finger protein (UPF0148 family)